MRSFLLVLAISSSCFADNCFNQHAIVQQVVVPHQVHYFVGQQVRLQAMVQKQLQQDPDYQEFLKFKQWKAQQKTPQQQVAKAKGLLNTLCAQCHGKAVAAGGFSFDGTNKISAEKFQLIVSWASGKVKPKGEKMPGVIKKLIDEKKTAQLLSELIDLQNQPGKKED